MERVAFLLEDTGERIGCLLNPESLVLRRRAGIQPRQSLGGTVTRTDRTDDALLYTGGGSTELTLNLLFDISLAGSSITTEDIRDLTGPLWELAENTRHGRHHRRPPLCRFVWGKSWNIPGVITAVAERLEYFTPGGTPRRSWLRMRLVRVMEATTPSSTTGAQPPSELSPPGLQIASGESIAHEILGGGPGAGGEGISGERLDQINHRYFGERDLRRELAAYNGLDDLIHIPAGHMLQIPSLSDLEGAP